jgi:predicted outer membrane repeat protein
MPPLAGSPAIDAAGTTDPTGTDQRGFPRFVDGDADGTAALDIGAVEAGPQIRVTTAADENDGIAVNGVSLRDAIAAVTEPDTRIVFDPAVFPAKITLTDHLLIDAKHLWIDGGTITGGLVEVSGGNATRLFRLGQGANAAFNALSLTEGNTVGNSGSNGGVVNVLGASRLHLLGCSLSGNIAGGLGGAVCVSGSSACAAHWSTFSNNQANGSTGGGAVQVIGAASSLYLAGCELNQNHAPNTAGAVYVASATADIQRCTFADNSAFDAGAVRNQGGTLRIDHSTFTGNAATSRGGAVGQFGTGCRTEIVSSTFSGNSADNSAGAGHGHGGGIFITANSGDFTLANTIVSGNTAIIAGPDIHGAVSATESVNLIGDVNAATGLGTLNVDYRVGAPTLAPLGDYGGPTRTMPPLPGSPAINAAGTVNPRGTDQRGFPRFVGGVLDIGAVEVGTPIPGFDGVVTSLVDTFDGLTTNGVSLREALAFTSPDGTVTFDAPLSGQTITLANGQLVIDKNLTIDASSLASSITINANQQSRVMEIRPGNTVALHGLTLTGGLATGASPADYGGAIYNDQSVLTLTACTLSGNSASYGGGIFSDGSSSGSATLALHHSTLSGNSAVSGGGIYSYGFSGSVTLALHHSTLSGNSATDSGGGIYSNGVSGSATLALHHSTLSGNSATDTAAGSSAMAPPAAPRWLSSTALSRPI